MNKKDLKTGMLVLVESKTTNGKSRYWNVVIDGNLHCLRNDSCWNLKHFTNDLKHNIYDVSVIKITAVCNISCVLYVMKNNTKAEDIEGFEIIWERPEDEFIEWIENEMKESNNNYRKSCYEDEFWYSGEHQALENCLKKYKELKR